MSDIRPGGSAVVEFQVRDLNRDPVTGLTGTNFTTTLKRRTTGAYSAASESVTIAEKSDGVYTASWTVGSDASGYTYFVLIQEKSNITLSAMNYHEFFLVAGDGTVATASDAYCSVDDVEGYIQRNRGADTKPSENQTLEFMKFRAAEITALISPFFAVSPASGSNPIDTTTDHGSALSDRCKSLNAQGAAVDVIMASDLLDRQGQFTSRASKLNDSWVEGMKTLYDFVASKRFNTRTGQTSSADRLSSSDRISIDVRW